MTKAPQRRERIETIETDAWKPLDASQQAMIGVSLARFLVDTVVQAASDLYPTLDEATLGRLLAVATARGDNFLMHQIMGILASREPGSSKE